MKKEYKEFPVTVYGQEEKINNTISKARCRIFYKYKNRNGTYITDEFAEELVKTLPYTPIKGIFSSEEEDFSGHGETNQEGRIYGIVPENTNFKWEDHADEDGIVRSYACTDIYIFSALYPEANKIVGKAQSMELYEPSINFHHEIIGGQKYFVFDKASFLGLQVLGDKVEPCFEGASFYSLVEEAINNIKQYSKGDETEMKLKFKLSDNQKHDALFTLLNPNYNADGEWTVEYGINEVYDDYAIVYQYETGKFQRAYYDKNDETDSIKIDKLEDIYFYDLTQEEKTTVDTLRKLNNNTFELVNEDLEKATEYKNKNVELQSEISTLKQTNLEEVENFEAQIKDLTEFKDNIELQEKEAVVSEYTDKLGEELLTTYRNKFEDLTAIELDKELAYELKKANASIFSKKPSQPHLVPKSDNGGKGGLEAILSKYDNQDNTEE